MFPSLKYVWLSFVVLCAAIPEIADRLTCRVPATYCDPPIYYMHLTAVLLLGITNLIQMRHLAKVLIMAIVVLAHCLLTTLVQQDVFDDFDRSQFGNTDEM